MAVTAADWARIEELLPQALALPPPDRPAFLRRNCGSSPGLLAELEALVAASDRPDRLLDPIGLSSSAPERDLDTLPTGTQLGAWRITEPIGHGGMGLVYAAERADGQFEMDAAVKVLKRGLDTDALLKRFLRERSILARLSHPNIARLLDAGATPDGRPYFVMERVRGEPITDWCRTRHSSVPEILRLIVKVCSAVAAAHRERIIHRDLKPSNVLVTAEGEIKLLDFGIAKALADDGENHTLTLADARLLTPSYAAPEQILGQPVTVVSDLYALGVILFQLLTGQLPHRREGLPIPVLAAEVRNETTARPSATLRRATASETEPPRPAGEIAGDLDLIVLKALHADPQRRYASAFELADDLARFLDRRPVLARPDSLGYRVGRFVQRYPIPVAAGGIAVLALVAGLAMALWQARVARAAAQRAEDNLATARAVSDFVTQDLLASIDPDKRSTANITLKEMLDTAAGQLDKRFADRPQVAAELHHALGQSYGGLGLPEDKRAQEASAAQLFEELYGPDAEPTLEARHEQGIALKRLGDLRGALDLQQDVYRRWLAQGKGERPEALTARLEMISLKEALGGSVDQTIAETRAVLGVLERTDGPEDLAQLAQFSLADMLKETADYAGAEAAYRALLRSLERHPATRYLMRARLEGALADVLTAEGKYPDADRQLAQLERELTTLVPPTHDQFLNLHLRYARLRVEEGRLAEAARQTEPLLQSASALWPLTARIILSEVEIRQGRYAEAVATADRLMRELVKLIPADDASFVEVAALLGEALTLAGRTVDAEQALAAGVPALPQLPPRHPMLAQYRRAEGLLRLSEGKPVEARAALTEALSIYEARLGHNHWRTQRVRDELARVHA